MRLWILFQGDEAGLYEELGVEFSEAEAMEVLQPSARLSFDGTPPVTL